MDISVIMPVYNSQKYISKSIASIVDQSYNDFELIIVNDGSSDRTADIIDAFCIRDARIKHIYRPNTGYVRALNEMLGLVRGEYIARMDADDIALPERFALQINFLRDNPEYVAVGGAVQEIDESERLLGTPEPVRGHEAIIKHLLDGINPIIHPAVMMRSDAIRKIGMYNPDLETTEDLDYWLRLCEVGRIENLAQVILRYRIHRESVSARTVITQMRLKKQICNVARSRRGMSPLTDTPPPHRPINYYNRFQFYLMYGWRAYHRQDWTCSIVYSLKAILCRPWNHSGWWLFLRVIHGRVRESASGL